MPLSLTPYIFAFSLFSLSVNLGSVPRKWWNESRDSHRNIQVMLWGKHGMKWLVRRFYSPFHLQTSQLQQAEARVPSQPVLNSFMQAIPLQLRHTWQACRFYAIATTVSVRNRRWITRGEGGGNYIMISVTLMLKCPVRIV